MDTKSVRAGYVVHLDFENLWIHNQRLALPSLTPGSGVPGDRVSPTAENDLHAQLERFPKVLTDIIKDHFGGETARQSVAMAMWHNLHLKNLDKLYTILQELSIDTDHTLPSHEIALLTKQDLKDGSDFALIAKILEIADGPGRDDATIVIGGGDCGPTYFVNYLTNRGFKLVFLSFSSNASSLLQRAARLKPSQVTYLLIDKSEIYKHYFAECVAIDPLKLYEVSLELRIEKTAIHTLWFAWHSKRAKKPWKPKEYLFKKQWIPDWLSYWRQRESGAGAAETQYYNEHHWFIHLIKTGIIEVKLEDTDKGKEHLVNLNMSNQAVIDSLVELEKSEKLFRLKYNVALKIRT